MNTHRVDYDQLAETFDQRYLPGQISEPGLALKELVAESDARRVLDVGCGTGHWLELLISADRFLFGIDYSRGMITRAWEKGVPAMFVQGDASQLPVKSRAFDLVYCVNALHHFAFPESFIKESHRVLNTDGILAIMGAKFPGNRENWYIYQYFEGVYEIDQDRFPPWEKVAGWLERAGFELRELVAVEHINDQKNGVEVLGDPFLQKHACSQLALLSDRAYQAGLSKIKSDLNLAMQEGREILFKSEIVIMMLSGRKTG